MKSMKNLILATAAMVIGTASAGELLIGPNQVPKGKPVRNTTTKAAYDRRKAKAKRQTAKASRKRNRAA